MMHTLLLIAILFIRKKCILFQIKSCIRIALCTGQILSTDRSNYPIRRVSSLGDQPTANRRCADVRR